MNAANVLRAALAADVHFPVGGIDLQFGAERYRGASYPEHPHRFLISIVSESVIGLLLSHCHSTGNGDGNCI